MHTLFFLLILGPPALRPLVDYEVALLERCDRELRSLAAMRVRLRHRHWLPTLRVQAAASAWDRLSIDTAEVDVDLRRQGYTFGASLEFRFTEIVLDDQELAIERERLHVERRKDELLRALHERYFEARAALLRLSDEHDRLRAEEAIHAVEAIAFGLRDRSVR